MIDERGALRSRGLIRRGTGRTLRGIRRLLPWAARLAVVLLAVHGLANVLVDRADAAAARGPSGILLGAEERDLGPEDATTAVLLVHGFLGGGSNFGALPEALAAGGVRVRVMRLPGHGESPRDLIRVAPARYLQSVLDEIRALKQHHERVVLAGFSMGGTLCTISAAIEEVDGLVLAAPFYRIPHQWYYGLRVETWSALTSPFIRWSYKSNAFVCVKRREAVPEVLSYRWVPTAGSRALFNLAKRARDPELLEAIECPVLWVHSPDDRASSFADAEKAIAALGSKTVERMPLANSDHHVFVDYEREEVVARISGFVAKIAGN